MIVAVCCALFALVIFKCYSNKRSFPSSYRTHSLSLAACRPSFILVICEPRVSMWASSGFRIHHIVARIVKRTGKKNLLQKKKKVGWGNFRCKISSTSFVEYARVSRALNPCEGWVDVKQSSQSRGNKNVKDPLSFANSARQRKKIPCHVPCRLCSFY